MSEATAVQPVRRRPRDRRQAIEAAAASAFAERGYHRVAMQDVADLVGITAAALYRHFDTKYDLFREVALGHVQRLGESTRDLGEAVTPEVEIVGLLDAVAGATIAMRATGGIYRWESRYLRDDDRHEVHAAFAGLRARIAAPAALIRTDLDPSTLDLLARAALSAIASVTAHRTVVPAAQLRSLVADAARRVLASSPGAAPLGEAAEQPEATRPRRRRDQLAQAGIELFAARGYHEVTIEDIAGAVGLTPSGVYRHFGGKAEILLTACQRAAAALDSAAEDALGRTEPLEALRVLEDAYLTFAIEDRDLMDVYAADVGALDDEDQRRLRRLQRAHVDDWVELLGRVRPELDAREARCLVHAGFNVVADLAIALRRSPSDAARAWMLPVLEAVLGV